MWPTEPGWMQEMSGKDQRHPLPLRTLRDRRPPHSLGESLAEDSVAIDVPLGQLAEAGPSDGGDADSTDSRDTPQPVDRDILPQIGKNAPATWSAPPPTAPSRLPSDTRGHPTR